MVSASEVREAWKVRTGRTPIESTMALTADGLLLGAGTVLANWRPGRQNGLDLPIGGEQRLLALLSIAYGTGVSPGVLGNIRRAASDWSQETPCLAHIHLARSRLPALPAGEAAPFRLFAAARLLDDGMNPRELLKQCGIDTANLDLLKAGYNPAELRLPAGNGRESGEWTTGAGGSAAAGGDDGAVTPVAGAAPADKDPFFDTLYGPVHDLSQRLGIDETWPLGLAAHEGGWLEKPHNREINNPFGVTHGGGRDVQYDSIDEAVAAWERRYGPIVQGATSAADFVQRLRAVNYNREDTNWSKGVLGAIRSVQRRLDSWKSRHGP